jgi:hypothetical protein
MFRRIIIPIFRLKQFLRLLDLEDGGTAILQNVDKCLAAAIV